MSELLIGWAEVDTTPSGTVDLCGQYYHRVSRGLHSPLAVTALALDGGNGQQAVMVTLDLVGIPAEFMGELRARLQVPGLDPASVMVNVTHTHSAPGIDTITGIAWLAELPEVMSASTYREQVLACTAQAVTNAWTRRAPGSVGNAFGAARIGHCRRPFYSTGTAEMYGRTDRTDFLGLEGGEDSGVDLLFTFDAAGAPTGVVLNVACPSQVMEATYVVSSDFMGDVRRRLKLRYGNTFRTLGQISAAGCQAPRDLTRYSRPGEPDFWHADGVEELGRRLEAAVVAAHPVAQAARDSAPVLEHRSRRLSLPRRRATVAECQAAAQRLRELEAIQPEMPAYQAFCAEVARNEAVPGAPGPYDSKLHHFVLIQNAKAVLARHADQDQRPSLDIECHFLRLGNVAFASNPFELYLDFGQQLKARSPAAQTFVVQLACGTDGYLPSARAESLGGYGGLIINGQIGSAGGKQLVDDSIGTITELWA